MSFPATHIRHLQFHVEIPQSSTIQEEVAYMPEISLTKVTLEIM